MKKYIYLIITTLLSLILGVFYIDAFRSVDHTINSIGRLVLLILLLILGVLITVFIYDLGHLLFTKIARYKVVSYKLLNAEISKVDGKTKLRYYPMKDHENKIVIASENENPHYITYYLGGVYTNLIIASILALIIMFINDGNFIKLLLITFGLTNVISAFANVLPLSFLYNDGYYLYNIMKDPVAVQAFHKSNSLIYKIVNGKNLDELNFTEYKIDNLNNDYNDPLILDLKEIETYYYLYRFQFKETMDTIDYVFKKSNHMLALYYKAFTNLKIVTLLLQDKNDEALNIYLSLSQKHKNYISKCKTIDDALAALAMHLLIEKDKEKAKHDYNKCMEFVQNTPYIGEKEPFKDLIDLILNK